jgi:hypothetical protein
MMDNQLLSLPLTIYPRCWMPYLELPPTSIATPMCCNRVPLLKELKDVGRLPPIWSFNIVWE